MTHFRGVRMVGRKYHVFRLVPELLCWNGPVYLTFMGSHNIEDGKEGFPLGTVLIVCRPAAIIPDDVVIPLIVIVRFYIVRAIITRLP